MFQNRFDQLYLTICKQVGGIEGLLKSFFDFMIRKTDFFYECDPGDKMGFPPGFNKKLLNGTFEQFQQQHYKRFPKKSIEEFNKKLQAYKLKQEQQKKAKQSQLKKLQQTKNKDLLRIEDKTQSKQGKKLQQKSNKVEQQKSQQMTNKSTQGSSQTNVQSKNSNIDLINTYNGGKNQKYSWSQEIRQVQVTLQIDPHLKAKQLKVKIGSKHLSVKDKNQNIIIEGQLYQKIDASQSVWKIQSIKGKSYLNFNLQKAQEKIWSTVFIGDPQIDTTKVNNTKNLQDFDGQTQGAIRKIMYEQQRKAQGLPTTDEQKQHEALKMAWNAEGSPFKGTPFDPSKLNLQGFKP